MSMLTPYRLRFFVIPLMLLAASSTLHLLWLDKPNEVVFDEIHFGKFTNGYVRGEYFFDIHPPLGKLMIAGMANIGGVEPRYAFETIGEHYPSRDYIWLRILPALFGSLLAPLIYMLTLRISSSMPAAAVAGALTLVDNALLVQSKFILMDSFLLFFGFAGLYMFLQSKDFFDEAPWGRWATVAGTVLFGLCISIKWTGIGFLGTALLFAGVHLAQRIIERSKITVQTILPSALLIVIPFVLYLSFFYLHFSLLPRPGPGNAFMTPRFHASQQAGYPLKDFLTNVKELNREMFAANQRITAEHAYSSRWYSWPLMIRSIYYWNDEYAPPDGAMEYRRIYFLGNPFVWWTATIFTIRFFFDMGTKIMARGWSAVAASKKKRHAIAENYPFTRMDMFIATGYLINFLPFAFIGRVMFLYHYLAAFMFSIIISGSMLARIRKQRIGTMWLVVVLAVLGFLAMAPITYGTVMKEGWPASVFWLATWI